MSHHSKGWRPQPVEAVRSQLLYTLSIKCCRSGSHRPDPLAGRLLTQIAGATLHGRICQPGQRALGRMHGRHIRSIQRSLGALVAGGFIEAIRRGRKITNVYRLAGWLWSRLTNRGVTGQLALPCLARADDAWSGALDALRRRWEASRGVTLPVGA